MDSGAPIYDAIQSYWRENPLRLHMPGHVGGRGLAEPFQALANLDLTEVHGLDDLHAPAGAIARARELLARAYGADESYFLVNGASSGIHALLLSLPEEAVVVVPRNAHRSFFGGMVLSGAHPVYLPVQIHPELGTGMAVTRQDLADMLADHQRVDAVFVTSPSYYGTTCSIAKLAELAHRYGSVFYVDEAHGGHFPFHPGFPSPALRNGADGAVNGLHKTLPVLNQGGALHIKRGRTPVEQLATAYSLLTTTSPSYPILASLDLARQLMMEQGHDLLEKSLRLAADYRKKINTLAGLHCYTEEEMKTIAGVAGLDPLKLLISVRDLTISGYETAALLREKYRIQVEAEDNNAILAMMSLFHHQHEWEELYRAMIQIAAVYGVGKQPDITIELPPAPRVHLSPRQAFYANKRRMPLAQTVGLIAGEMVAAYPPGIPCLLPGEIITEEIYDYLCYLKNSPVRLQGPSQPGLETLLVIERTR